jgi:hypothetical protein
MLKDDDDENLDVARYRASLQDVLRNAGRMRSASKRSLTMPACYISRSETIGHGSRARNRASTTLKGLGAGGTGTL